MSNAIFQVPVPKNEKVLSYGPGSPEKKAVKAALKALKSKELDIPMTINGKKVKSGNLIAMHPPHELAHTLGYFHQGGRKHVKAAIDAALSAKQEWENMPWEDRAAIFLEQQIC